MNQNGISRWFQIALWGSRTKAQNERTVNDASTMPRRSRTAKATTTATPAITMTQRSPPAPPPVLIQPSVEKMSWSVPTGTLM